MISRSFHRCLTSLLFFFSSLTAMDYGVLPLHQAIERNDFSALKSLLGSGLDIHECDETGNTPLHCAARDGNFACVNILLNYFPSVKRKNVYGQTPLHFVMSNNEKAPARAMIIGFLLNRGAIVNDVDLFGYTPLVHAVLHNFCGGVRVLLHYGARVDFLEKYSGDNLLHIALKKRALFELIWLLVRHGCDINLKNSAGLLPIDIARRLGRQDVVELFVQAALKGQKYLTESAETCELALLLNCLDWDVSDILLLAIGARGYEIQEIPAFMKELAKQFPDKRITIFSICDQMENFSSLSLSTKSTLSIPENSSFVQDLKFFPLEVYVSSLFPNLRVISSSCHLPLRKNEPGADQIIDFLDKFIRYKLDNGCILFLANNTTSASFHLIPEILALYTRIKHIDLHPRGNNLQLSVKSESKAPFFAFDPLRAPSSVTPTVLQRYASMLPKNLEYAAFSHQGYVDGRLRYAIERGGHNLNVVGIGEEALEIKESSASNRHRQPCYCKKCRILNLCPIV